jgi:hypothetical protein
MAPTVTTLYIASSIAAGFGPAGSVHASDGRDCICACLFFAHAAKSFGLRPKEILQTNTVRGRMMFRSYWLRRLAFPPDARNLSEPFFNVTGFSLFSYRPEKSILHLISQKVKQK